MTMSAAREPYRNSFAKSATAESAGPGDAENWTSAWAEKLRCASGPQAWAAVGTARMANATAASDARLKYLRCPSAIRGAVYGARPRSGNGDPCTKARSG